MLLKSRDAPDQYYCQILKDWVTWGVLSKLREKGLSMNLAMQHMGMMVLHRLHEVY